jgi:hypothetical protein
MPADSAFMVGMEIDRVAWRRPSGSAWRGAEYRARSRRWRAAGSADIGLPAARDQSHRRGDSVVGIILVCREVPPPQPKFI